MVHTPFHSCGHGGLLFFLSGLLEVPSKESITHYPLPRSLALAVHKSRMNFVSFARFITKKNIHNLETGIRKMSHFTFSDLGNLASAMLLLCWQKIIFVYRIERLHGKVIRFGSDDIFLHECKKLMCEKTKTTVASRRPSLSVLSLSLLFASTILCPPLCQTNWPNSFSCWQ